MRQAGIRLGITVVAAVLQLSVATTTMAQVAYYQRTVTLPTATILRNYNAERTYHGLEFTARKRFSHNQTRQDFPRANYVTPILAPRAVRFGINVNF